MMKIEMTHHASVDRLERLSACIEYLGMNEIIREVPDNRHNRLAFRCLTDTGIILIKGDDGKLITGYMATVAQVASLYPNEKIPTAVLNRVKKNVQKYKFLLKM